MFPALTLLASMVLPAAQAAEVTELAPMLRGDVQLRYDIDAERGRLVEGDQTVGRRVLTDHTLNWTGSFSILQGAALFIELPQSLSQRVAFKDAHAMGFDPVDDVGTMVDTPALADADPTVGSGMGGTWLGMKGAPFSETLYQRGDRVSWLLEAAVRFKDKTNFWTYGPRGTRGGGPGAPAFRLRGAFSTTHRSAQPYLVATWTRAGRINTDVVDDAGRVVARDLELRPSSDVELVTGSELNVAQYGDGARVDLDFKGRFGYRSWQDIPSGLYLPDVLDASRALTATESEYAYVSGGFGVNWRIIHYLQWNVSGDVGFTTPRTIEHFYPVSTGMGTMTWGVTTSLRFRIRDELFATVKPTLP